ncbi:MAG TPA: hypothetical protein VEO95_11440 [Chthoniobacteraceae bacterium]|nr:hypothetical protein [Chthoniobacteraceae bacterium]
MILFFVLLVAMFLALVVQHFIPPLPPMGARVLIMPIIMFYGALALPLPAMFALTLAGGLMWDALHTSWQTLDWNPEHTDVIGGTVEIALGWSIVLYAILGGLMSGFRPLFQRGRWEIHCLFSGLATAVIVLVEYLMLTFRRDPVTFVFNQNIWWNIAGSGIVATLLSPFFFFALNYIALLTGYDPQPLRKQPKR